MLWKRAWCLAPKGRDSIAQGEALGNRFARPVGKPQRGATAQPGGVIVAPLQGFGITGARIPGLRPGLSSGAPSGLTPGHPKSGRANRGIARIGLVIGLVVVAAGVAGAVAVLRIDPSGQQGNRLPAVYNYDLSRYKRIDPALIQYAETGGFPLSLAEARAIAAGPDDKIYVAGDRAVLVFDAQGRPLAATDAFRAAGLPDGRPGIAPRPGLRGNNGSRRGLRRGRQPLGRLAEPVPKALLTSLAAGRAGLFRGRRRKPHRLALQPRWKAAGADRRSGRET